LNDINISLSTSLEVLNVATAVTVGSHLV